MFVGGSNDVSLSKSEAIKRALSKIVFTTLMSPKRTHFFIEIDFYIRKETIGTRYHDS